MKSAVGGEAGSGCRASETDGIRRCSRIADTGDYGHARDVATAVNRGDPQSKTVVISRSA